MSIVHSHWRQIALNILKRINKRAHTYSAASAVGTGKIPCSSTSMSRYCLFFFNSRNYRNCMILGIDFEARRIAKYLTMKTQNCHARNGKFKVLHCQRSYFYLELFFGKEEKIPTPFRSFFGFWIELREFTTVNDLKFEINRAPNDREQ